MKKYDTRRIVMIGVFSALAFIMACIGNLIQINIAGFLNYDPKDIIIVIAGFILGPISAIIISVIASLLEVITISATGPIGFAMNIISTCFFVVPAVLIYQKKRTFPRAIIGLCVGVLSMCVAMMLWNYLITPLYIKGATREMVAKMLPTVFFPFNLVKGALNAALVMLLYKPVVRALRHARLLDKVESKGSDTKALLIVSCVMIIAVCILGFLILAGVI
ncbi:MAG: ECF transporter S component [Clostridia bacterium]|nr:ECF transporter S component [Clostridia bacterium]